MSTVHASGDLVYNEHGERFSYVARTPEGHVALRLYGDGEDEPFIGDPALLRAVFAEPPAPQLDGETAKARELLADLQAQVSAARAELAQVTGRRAEALRAIESHPDLRPVVEWLEGRITHVASLPRYGGAGIAIQTLEQAIMPASADDRRNGYVRLLGLYGGRAGVVSGKNYDDDFRWQLSAYHDGSGDLTRCFLGTSEEHVKERLQAWLDKRFKNTREYGTVELARSALRVGLRVPDDLAEQVRKEDEANEERRRQQAAQELARAEQRAAELRASLAGGQVSA